MEAIKGIYHADKLNSIDFIENFTIRVKEFNSIIAALKKQKGKSLQHFLITGKRGMGKSTLLRRIDLEANSEPLSDKLIAVRLGSEQYKLSRLYKLWEEVIKYLTAVNPQMEDQRKKLSDERNYEEHIIQIILDYLNTQHKTLLLLIDNFDQFIDKISEKEQHAFREILIQYPIQIIGNSVFYDEHFYSYNKPFFDFFKPVHLKNLEKKEAEEFILQLAKNENIEGFETIIKKQKGKIQTLRILSGGVPRTLVILLSILSKNNTGSAIDYLHEMLEQVTPLYQDRMKALSSQQQEIMHHLAISWDRTPVKELAKEMRLPSKSISAQLVQLENNGYINKINTSNRNLFYEIDERFFNIWLLMSEASAYDSKRVIWLTRWLDMFYEFDELEDFALSCNKSLKESRPMNRFLVVQALIESKRLTATVKNKIIDDVSKDLADTLPEMNDLVRTYEKKKTTEIEALYSGIQIQIDEKKYENALEKLVVLQQTGPANAFSGMAIVYEGMKDYRNAEKYYIKAIKLGHVNAMFNLGLFYEVIKKDYANAEKYYLMAVEKGDVDSINNLAILYYSANKNTEKQKAIKLIEMINKGETDPKYISTKVAILLWNEQINKAEKIFGDLLEAYITNDESVSSITSSFAVFLIFKQKQFLYKLFIENKDSIKDRFKPLYYALMHEMQTEFPDEYLKMPEEISEPVNDLLAVIKAERIRLKIN
jgi:Tfp pilus assembly protein PilF